VADLERMLHLLIAEPGARNNAGHCARQRLQEQYLWDSVSREIEQVYLQLNRWKEPETNRSSLANSVRNNAA